MTGDSAPETALRIALGAIDLAYAAPPRARRLAQTARSTAGDDREAAAVAERALGMANTALGELAEAESHLRVAIALAEEADLAVRAGEARGSLAYLLAIAGRSAEALAEVAAAAPALAGPAAARLQMQRALVLNEIGEFSGAAGGFDEALQTLTECGGDPMLEGDIHNNRSLVHIRLRNWGPAEDDLAEALILFEAAGHVGKTASVYHNQGWAAALRGDLPAALTAYDLAADRYRAAGRDSGLLAIDRAEALLQVLLVDEARRTAELAVAQFRRQRNAVDLVQARLLLARSALLSGDYAFAADEAGRARRSARRQQRPGWAALAGYLVLRADWESKGFRKTSVRAGIRTVRALSEAGWAVEALDARLVVARMAIELGQLSTARRELAKAAHPPDGPAQVRAGAWHAQALLCLSDGDQAGAQAALVAGMQVLDAFRAGLGATELRVHAAGHAGELARLGTQIALAADDPDAVFIWAERWRAGTLMLRPARPADDAELSGLLAELRQIVTRITETVTQGGDTAALLGRQVQVEEAVRRRSRRTSGKHAVELAVPPSPAKLRATLGNTVLVEFLAMNGELSAILVDAEATQVRRIGALAPIERDIAALRSGLRRLAYERGSAQSLSAAGRLVAYKAKAIDELLLAPLIGDGRHRRLVIVPTGALHAIPWAALGSCSGRSVSIAPSAALWHRAMIAPPAMTGRRVFAAGPDLPHAAMEVRELALGDQTASCFTGQAATVGAVIQALDGADLAHIAAHGSFRADNPLFSALRLIDGPLTVYDVERLANPPRLVVLSACESGLSAVHPGDEMLGLAGALLAMGASSLVAAVIPVPDEGSRPLMLRLHSHLRAGEDPATALALAQGELADADPATRVAATGFLCFGTGQ